MVCIVFNFDDDYLIHSIEVDDFDFEIHSIPFNPMTILSITISPQARGLNYVPCCILSRVWYVCHIPFYDDEDRILFFRPYFNEPLEKILLGRTVRTLGTVVAFSLLCSFLRVTFPKSKIKISVMHQKQIESKS